MTADFFLNTFASNHSFYYLRRYHKYKAHATMKLWPADIAPSLRYCYTYPTLPRAVLTKSIKSPPPSDVHLTIYPFTSSRLPGSFSGTIQRKHCTIWALDWTLGKEKSSRHFQYGGHSGFHVLCRGHVYLKRRSSADGSGG